MTNCNFRICLIIIHLTILTGSTTAFQNEQDGPPRSTYLDNLLSTTLCGKYTSCKIGEQMYCCEGTNSDPAFRPLKCCSDASGCCPESTNCCGIYCCEYGDICKPDGCYKKTTYKVPVGIIGTIIFAVIGWLGKMACTSGGGGGGGGQQQEALQPRTTSGPDGEDTIA